MEAMITVSGYTVEEKVYESRHTLVYRGRRVSDGQPVALKTHRAAYPGPSTLTRFRRDYDLGRQVEADGVITYYGLVEDNQRLILIQEDFGAVSLKEVIPDDGFDLSVFLDIAIQLAEALTAIHRQQIIHKDLKPGNIVVALPSFPPPGRTEGGQWLVKVIDFGLATQLTQEMPQFSSPNRLEGTLVYISPEQTGRMNRAIDYRTDFYSLGIVFYECLCGHLPFETSDALELVHSHLARTPLAPHRLNPNIPQAISDIVMKLLAKNAEDRYQSGYGLKADLLKGRIELESRGEITPFTPGTQDVSGRFHLPQKLYGRKQEIEVLLAAFERISTPPQSPPNRGGSKGEGRGVEILLVSGYSGVGKSALVREIHKPVTQKRGYFTAGKYDPLQRDVPYSAFTQAFNEFCAYLLTEPEDNLAAWQEKILEAVGPNGQVLIDLIPKLAQVIGPQPPVAQVGPQEAQNRFNLLFQNFVKIICRPEHPLALFLDDLQWADLASLNLLQTLLADDEIQHLLFIGAYRDNEVDSAHPLLLTLAALEQEGKTVKTLELKNLALPDVTALLAGALQNPRQPLAGLADLSALIYEKTQGNVFFTIEFLKSLYEAGLLTFRPDEQGGQWLWDIEKIRRQNISDNVVTLMAGKISKLAPETQTLLKLAACLGNQFDLTTLALISPEQTEQPSKVLKALEVLQQLWPALQEGLILSLDNNYKALPVANRTSFENLPGLELECKFKFAHDRIRQAAYSLIAASDRAAVHLQLGRLLAANVQTTPLNSGPPDQTSPALAEASLFEIINQFNQAGQLLTGQTEVIDEAEKIKIARLNLQAGQKARQTAAYPTAAAYLKAGVELLAESLWQSHYPLMFQLHQELAETTYLSGDFEAAEKLYPLILQQAQSDLDKLDIYLIQMTQFEVQSRYLQALEVGKAGLKLLGVALPEAEAEIKRLYEVELAALPRHLGKRKIGDLVHAPRLTDEKLQRLLKLLSILAVCARISSQTAILIWASTKMVNLSLLYGHTEVSAYAYVNFGVGVAGPVLGDYEMAYQFGKMATELSDNFDNLFYRGRTHLAFTSVNLWKKHLSLGAAYQRNAYHFCLASGDLAFASYAIFHLINGQLIYGHNLAKVYEEAQRFLPFLKRTNVALLEGEIKPGAFQPLANLLGLTYSPATFDNDDFSEQRFLQASQAAPLFQAIFYSGKIRSLYWFGLYQAGLHLLDKVELMGTVMGAMANLPEAYFFMSLTLTALYPEASAPDQAKYEEILTRYQSRMKYWAERCPDNFLHKYLLVEAERARVTAKFTTAMKLYKQGIASAKAYHYLNNEALGNELYARFWLEQAETEVAQLYLVRAYTLYKQWGAVAKAADLDHKYGPLLALPGFEEATGRNDSSEAIIPPSSPAILTQTGLLDLRSVIKASQTISEEIALDKLLSKLMRIVIENAGAQKGYLVLETNSQLCIEAAGIVDESDAAILQSLPIAGSSQLSEAIVRYVFRSGENVVLPQTALPGFLAGDAYLLKYQPKSVLCIPLRYQDKITGVLYLENNVTAYAFTKERVEVLQVLLAQAAISLEKAFLYDNLSREIVERKRAEETLKEYSERLEKALADLREAQERLIRQEKLAVLGQLAGGVGHELRNPLGVIANAVYFLQMVLAETDETVKEYLELIASRIGEVDKIVTDLLDLSRTRPAKRQPTPLFTLVAETLQRYPPPEPVTVTTTIAPDLPAVFVDAQQIGQVLGNLISNAYQAMPEGGQLTLAAQVMAEWAKLSVTDTGVGMAPETLAKIFEPLFTTRVKGIGLGLAVSKNLVEVNGGTIEVKSVEGQGSTFIVILPASE